MAQFRNKNLMVAVGLVGFGLLGASFPLVLTKTRSHNTVSTEGPLSGQTIMRGPYVNTGSQDIGPDPDYDVKTGTWHGRRNS
jgi:hypothetical protein